MSITQAQHLRRRSGRGLRDGRQNSHFIPFSLLQEHFVCCQMKTSIAYDDKFFVQPCSQNLPEGVYLIIFCNGLATEEQQRPGPFLLENAHFCRGGRSCGELEGKFWASYVVAYNTWTKMCVDQKNGRIRGNISLNIIHFDENMMTGNNQHGIVIGPVHNESMLTMLQYLNGKGLCPYMQVTRNIA